MKIGFIYPSKASARLYRIGGLGLGFLAAALIAGCSGDFGRIHWDADVTQAFEKGRVQPDLTYYYYGIGMQTYAIVGLDPKWELNSILWRQLEADTEEFNVVKSRIWYNDLTLPDHPRGAIILDPVGDKVGVYFSSLPFVSIKFRPESQVMVMLDTMYIRGGPDGGNSLNR
jgi:hypothetical protein